MDELPVCLYPGTICMRIAVDIGTATAHDVRVAVSELQNIPTNMLAVCMGDSFVPPTKALAEYARADLETQLHVVLCLSQYVLVQVPCGRVDMLNVCIGGAFVHFAEVVQGRTEIPVAAQRWVHARTGAIVPADSHESFIDLGIVKGDVLVFAAAPGHATVRIEYARPWLVSARMTAFVFPLADGATFADVKEAMREHVDVPEPCALSWQWRSGACSHVDDDDDRTALAAAGVLCGDVITCTDVLRVRVLCAERAVCCRFTTCGTTFAQAKARVSALAHIDVHRYVVCLVNGTILSDSALLVRACVDGTPCAVFHLLVPPAGEGEFLVLQDVHAPDVVFMVPFDGGATTVGDLTHIAAEKWEVAREVPRFYRMFNGAFDRPLFSAEDPSADTLLADIGVGARAVVRVKV